MACSLKLVAWGLKLAILFYLSLELEAWRLKLVAWGPDQAPVLSHRRAISN